MPAATMHSPQLAPASASPFLLHNDDVDTLAESDGFQILRNHLAQHYNYALCNEHAETQPPVLDRWIVVRDLLHALLVPVVELFDKAVNVAAQATRAINLEDLEYAYTGQARSAFVWLQCFLSSEKEQDWCFTNGCPVCVVNRSLDSEFSIRLLYAACLLSDVHYPFTIEGPTLPSFMFFLTSLEVALADDPLYGPGFFEHIGPKATATRDGVEDLIHQCLELDNALSQSSPSSDPSSPDISQPASPILVPMGGPPGMKIKRSKMARRQMRMKREAKEWMDAMVKQCWNIPEPTIRGLTPVSSTHSMESVLKTCATAAVKEMPVIVEREVRFEV
ncbi:Hypothetical protein R9X50_00277100 [Acrodontium crateriforme]|uniref:Uncharacterized protein n=1 Tax=Acrodontium crateriforme TaxID=150365 RepID=A0AAQ3M1X1_9PEZI|nr:Hypothetical protein R9X50_00277100 [Acrodontium crateriforme]